MQVGRWLLALSLALSACTFGERPANSIPPTTVRLVRESIAWEYNVQDAAQEANRTSKPLLIYFYNDYCEWCRMTDDVFKNPDIVQIVNDRFIAVRVNTLTSEFAKTSGVTVVPTFIVVVATPEGGNPVGIGQGFMSAPSLLAFLTKTLP